MARRERTPTGPAFVPWWWLRQPGKIFFGGRKDEDGRWRQKAFARGKIVDFPAWAERYEDNDLYFCPHGFERGIRKEKYASQIWCFFCDHDLADPHRGPQPSVLIRTSPQKHQGLWQADGPVSKAQNKALTQFLGADPGGFDPTQMLRVPGTTNWKPEYDEPTVRIVSATGRVWGVAEVLAGAVAAGMSATAGTRPGVPPGGSIDIAGFDRLSSRRILDTFNLRGACAIYMMRHFGGDRSRVIWALGKAAIERCGEQGIDIEPAELACLLWNCPAFESKYADVSFATKVAALERTVMKLLAEADR